MERIITPVIKSYLNKYFLNVPDLRLSIWGGDVVLNNLELRLEVLEKELLKGVASVLSIKRGFIRALRIHIPWTQLTYQSIQLDINTIELIVTSKKPEDNQSNPNPSTSHTKSPENDQSNSLQRSDSFSAVSAGLSIADPVGVSQRWVQPLLMKITTNVEITISNLILKYIEDDIAVTLSCKLIKLLSALPASKASQAPPTPTDPIPENSPIPASPEPFTRQNSSEQDFDSNNNTTFSSTWKREFVDPGENNLVSKICHIEGLTLCIDRMSSQGKMNTWQDPVINRVNVSMRIMMFMNDTKQRIDQQSLPSKRVDITFQSLDISFTDTQLAMLRVIVDKIMIAWKQRPKKKKVPLAIPPPKVQPSPEVLKAQPPPTNEQQTGWLSWAWSLVEEPEYTNNDNEGNQSDSTPPLPTEFHWGFFIQQARVAFKRDTRDHRNMDPLAEKKFLPVIHCDINSFALELATKPGQPLQLCSGLRDISVYYSNDDSYPLFEIRCEEKVSVDCLPCSLFDDPFIDGVFAVTESPRSGVIPLSQNYNRWKVFEGINLILNSTSMHKPGGIMALRRVLNIEVGSLQGVYNVHAFTDFRHYLSCLKSTRPPSKPKYTNHPDAKTNWLEAPPMEFNFSFQELVLYAPLQQASQQDFNTPALFVHVPSIGLSNKDSIVESLARHLASSDAGQAEEYLDHLISLTGARVGCVTELASNPMFGSLYKEYLDTAPMNLSVVWRRRVWSKNPAEHLNASFRVTSDIIDLAISKPQLRLIGAVILASRSHEVLHWSKFPFTKHTEGGGSFRIQLLKPGVQYQAYQHKKSFSVQLDGLVVSHERDCSCLQKDPSVILSFPVAVEVDKRYTNTVIALMYSGISLIKGSGEKPLEVCLEIGPDTKRIFLRLRDLALRYDSVTNEWLQLITALLKSKPKASPTLPDNNTDPSSLYPLQQKWTAWSPCQLDVEIHNPRVIISEKHIHFPLHATRHAATEHALVHTNFALLLQLDSLIAKSGSHHELSIKSFKALSLDFLGPSHQIPFPHVHEQTITDISLQCNVSPKGSVDITIEPFRTTIHHRQFQAFSTLTGSLKQAHQQHQQALLASLHEHHSPRQPAPLNAKPKSGFSGFFDMEIIVGVKLPSLQLELVTSPSTSQSTTTDSFLLEILNTSLAARGGPRSTEATFLIDSIQLHHTNAEKPMILWPAKINHNPAIRIQWLLSNQESSIQALNTKVQVFAQPIHITVWADSIAKCTSVFKVASAGQRNQPLKPKGPPKVIAPVATIMLEGITVFLPACVPKIGHEGLAINLQGIQLSHKQSKLVHPDPTNGNSEGSTFFILHNYELAVKRVEARSVFEILPEYDDPTEAPAQPKSLLVHPFTVHTDISIHQSSLEPSLSFPVESPIITNTEISAVKASLDGTQYRLIRRIVKLAKNQQVPGTKKPEGPPSEGGGLAINSQVTANKVDIVVHEAQELFWVTFQNVSFKQVHETQRAKLNHLLRKQKTTVSIGGLFTNQPNDSVPYVLQRNANAAANNPAKPMLIFQATSIKGAKNVKDVRYSCEVQPVLCSVDLQRIEQFIAFMKVDTPDSSAPISVVASAPPAAAPSFTQTPSTLGIKIVLEQIDLNVLARFAPDNRNYVLSLSANQVFAITEPREEITMSPQMASIALSNQAPETVPDPIKIHWNVVDLSLSLQVPELSWKSPILQPCQIQSALTVSSHPVAKTVSVDLETKLLDIRIGAEHVMVLKSMADRLVKSLQKPPGHTKPSNKSQSVEFHSTNDLREGHFRLISQRDIRPNAGEITFSSDEAATPWMCWRYREPRSLSTVVSNPLPFPVETSNMENSELWLCTLSYWDEFQDTYVLFQEFSIHESLPQAVPLPNKGIYSYEWQIKLNRRTKETSSSAPFSPTVLAISLKVDSIFTADFIPKLRFSVGVSLARLFVLYQKLDHLPPVEQEFFTISLDDTRSRFGLWNSNILCSVHTAIQALATNYQDLTQICVIEKFPFSFIIDKISDSEEQKSESLGTINIISKSNDTSYRRFRVITSKIEFNMQDSIIHMLVTAARQFQSALQHKGMPSKPAYAAFYLRNSTTLPLLVGQHGTDEVVTLLGNSETWYSWRTKALRRDLRLWGIQDNFVVVVESALMESDGLHSKKMDYMGASLQFWFLVQSKGRAQHLITFLGTHSITNSTAIPLQVTCSSTGNAHTEDVLVASHSIRGVMVPSDIRSATVMIRTISDSSHGSQWAKLPVSPGSLIEFPDVGAPQQGYLPPCLWGQVSDLSGHTSISFSPVFTLHNQTCMELSFRSSHHIINSNDDIIQFPVTIPPGGSVMPHINPHHLPLLAFSFHPKQNAEQDLWSYPLSLSGTVIQEVARRGRPNIQYLDMQMMIGYEASPVHVPLMLTMVYSPGSSAFHLYFSFQCEVINTTEDTLLLRSAPRTQPSASPSPLLQNHSQAPAEQTIEIPSGATVPCHWNHWSFDSQDGLLINIGFPIPKARISSEHVMWSDSVLAVDSSRNKERQILVEMRSVYTPSPATPTTMHYQIIAELIPVHHHSSIKGLSTLRMVLRPSVSILNKTSHTLAVKSSFLDAESSEYPRLITSNQSIPLNFWTLPKSVQGSLQDLIPMFQLSINQNGSPLTWSKKIEAFKTCSRKKLSVMSHQREWIDVSIVAHKGALNVILFKDKPTMTLVNHLNHTDQTLWYGQLGTEECQPLKHNHPSEYYWYSPEEDDQAFMQTLRDEDEEVNDNNDTAKSQVRTKLLRIKLGEELQWSPPIEIKSGVQILAVPDSSGQVTLIVHIVMEGSCSVIEFWNEDVFFQHPLSLEASKPALNSTVIASVTTDWVFQIELEQISVCWFISSKQLQSTIPVINTPVTEILHLVLDNVSVGIRKATERSLFMRSKVEYLLGATIETIQIDNQLSQYEFPVMLTSYKTSSAAYYAYTPQPVFKASIGLVSSNHNFHIRHLDVDIASILIRVEDSLLYFLKNVTVAVMDSIKDGDFPNGIFTLTEPASVTIPQPILSELRVPQSVVEKELTVPLFIEQFRVSAVTIHLTVHATLGLFLGMDKAPIYFEAVELSSIRCSVQSLLNIMMAKYITDALRSTPALVGSLEFLGNPTGFLRNITNGLRDVLMLPMQGLFKGPGAFLVGIQGGTFSLLKNVSEGTFSSVSGLATALARNIDRLSFDDAFITYKQQLRRQRGLGSGVKFLGHGILNGITGVIWKPLEGAYNEGITGFVKGAGKGMLSLLTKPVGGTLDMISNTSQTLLSATVGSDYYHERRRPPKVILGFQYSSLHYHRFLLADEHMLIKLEMSQVSATGTSVDGVLILSSNNLYIMSEDAIRTQIALKDVARLEESLTDKKLLVIVPKINPQDLKMFFHVNSVAEKSALVVTCQRLLSTSQPQLLIPGSV